jgi:hypothetical protein
MDRLFLFPSARAHDPAVARWFDDRPGPTGTLARATFARLRAAAPDMGELLHDNRPTACIDGAAFAQVGLAARHVTLSFFRGTDLPDPAGLLAGAGRLMRHVRLTSGAPPDPALDTLIAAAVAQMRAMLSS